MALTASAKLIFNGTHTSALDLGTASMPISLIQTLTWSDGTGSGNADRVFTDTRTITASSNEDIDLSGALTNAYGTVTFARLKLLIITADSANTNNVVITRPASNGVPLFAAASDAISVRPGGFFAWGCTDATAVVVTAGTGDLINISNSSSGTSVTYSIVALGTSV